MVRVDGFKGYGFRVLGYEFTDKGLVLELKVKDLGSMI
jgi:hypothetical protein